MKLLCSIICLLVVAIDALSIANHHPLIATTTSSSALWRNSLLLGRHTSIQQQSTTSRLFVSSPSSIDRTNIQPTLSNNENQTNNDADDDTSPEREHYDAVIVGGGPAGLLSAIMLAQRQRRHQQPTSTSSSSVSGRRRIIVYDRLPPPPPPNDPIYSVQSSKYYLLGIGHRGQSSLKHFNVWKYVEDASVAVFGRRGWEPGLTNEEDGKITLSNKEVTSRILPRDKLVSVLKNIIDTKYMDLIDLRYGFQVDPISFGNDYDKGEEEGCDGPPVTLQVSRTENSEIRYLVYARKTCGVKEQHITIANYVLHLSIISKPKHNANIRRLHCYWRLFIFIYTSFQVPNCIINNRTIPLDRIDFTGSWAST